MNDRERIQRLEETVALMLEKGTMHSHFSTITSKSRWGYSIYDETWNKDIEWASELVYDMQKKMPNWGEVNWDKDSEM